MSSSLLRRRSPTLPLLIHRLTLLRPMGGGPRTFPGGLSKWQYKRMHEKLAREKERKLLNQEKQLYEARLRSEIRANRASATTSAAPAGPMSSQAHIKALADRFMKDGAEDLWNKDDGPLRSPARPPRSPPPPIDLRKLIGDNHSDPPHSFNQRRGYSAVAGTRRWRRNSSSDEDDDLDQDVGSSASLPDSLLRKFQQGGEVEKKELQGLRLERKKEMRFLPRFSVGGDESEGEVSQGRGERRKMMSGAALKNHDVKVKRRVTRPRPAENEGNILSERTQELRNLVNKRPVFDSDAMLDEAKEDCVLTQKRFDECGISPLTIEALASAGYLQMTVVQEAALPVCLEGKDALVKARTGTGKSAAFLLPAIEAVLKGTTGNTNTRVPPINVLILSPTRELAIQIAAEANVMLKHHEGIGVQTLIGGTRFKHDQKRLESDPCQIIVATPGRLLDHIENKSGFSMRLMGLKMLILDEADHLLDLGFRKDIENIIDCLPRQRQSLLFSATIPKEVRRISQLVLKKEHTFVDTVGLGGLETPVKILQSYLVTPHEVHCHILHHILKDHIMKEPDYKVMLFCTTAMMAAFTFVFLRGLKMNVMEMHSRKPQLYRSRISDEFRESKRVILVTSDVSSRGVNYPDVTLVIQVGIPPDREHYIHRVGRTGREGKSGKGILLLAPWEEYFMDEIRDLPVEKSQPPELDPDMKQKVEESIGRVDTSIKEAAYHAWLGYYNSISEIGRDKTTLAALAGRFSHSIGLPRPPELFRKTALKMGLKDIPGIRIRK